MFGIIKFYKREKGYGFLRVADPNASDIFFHISECDGDESRLARGASVEFELGRCKEKQVARNVRVLHSPETELENALGAAALGGSE